MNAADTMEMNRDPWKGIGDRSIRGSWPREGGT